MEAGAESQCRPGAQYGDKNVIDLIAQRFVAAVFFFAIQTIALR
jgi:hypothetical protein